MATISLKQIAQLSTGFTIRESIDYLEYGEVKTIQIKDLYKNTDSIDGKECASIAWKYDSKPQFLAHKTILLLARGFKPSAYLFTGDIADKVVASNPFITINLTEERLIPEYLLWYLNHSNTSKHYFSSILSGANLPILRLSSVKELSVKIPPLEVQQQIIERHQKALFEKQCFEQLIALRAEYNGVLAEQLLNTN